MSTAVRCLVLDDEPLAADVIKNYLQRLPDTVVFSSQNVVDAFQVIQKEKIDLLFLDIEMPVMSGLDFLHTLQTPPAVIITTAYRDYAVESFEDDALDYLVKPISFPRFMKGYQKALQHLQRENHLPDENGDIGKAHLFLKAGGKLVKVALSDILYIESLKDYIKVVTGTGFLISYQTLTGITEKLPPEKFMRLHRSFTVALDKITAVETGGVLITSTLIPISRDLRQEVIRRVCGRNPSS